MQGHYIFNKLGVPGWHIIQIKNPEYIQISFKTLHPIEHQNYANLICNLAQEKVQFRIRIYVKIEKTINSKDYHVSNIDMELREIVKLIQIWIYFFA